MRDPQLGVFTRSLTWEISENQTWQHGLRLPTEKVWSAFETLRVVHTLDLKATIGDRTSAPKKPLFPNLQVARIEGHFPEGSLQKILHTSPYLRELRIVGKDTGEHKYFRLTGLDITPFLQYSIDQGAFPRLQILELCVARKANLDVVVQFLAAHCQTLIELSVEITHGANVDHEWIQSCLFPLFQVNNWPGLRSLTLTNIPLPLNCKDDIFGYCDTLSDFTVKWHEGGNVHSRLYTRDE